MKKADLLNLVRDELELGTKKGAQDFLDNLDKVIEALAEKSELDDKIKLGKYIALQKKHFEAKTGKCNGREWSTDAHDSVLVRATNGLKNILK